MSTETSHIPVNRRNTLSDIKQQIRIFVVDNFMIGDDPASLSDSDSFTRSHVLDSTGFLELVSFLEKEFGVEVGDNELTPENLDSLDNLARFLSRKGVVA